MGKERALRNATAAAVGAADGIVQLEPGPVPLYYQYVLGRAARAPTLADQKHSFALAVRLWQRLPIAAAGVLGRGVKRLFPEAL